MTLTVFLIVFAFFGGLSLDLGLSLRLIYINREKIVAELNLIFILMVLTRFILLSKFMMIWISEINLSHF